MPSVHPEVERDQPAVRLRALSTDELGRLEPLWLSLHEHHVRLSAHLAGMPARSPSQSWSRRQANYVKWARHPGTFVLVAEGDGHLVGYAFVTIGSGYSSWDSGDRQAQLETLAVAPSARGRGIGTRLLAAVCERLADEGITRVVVSAACANHGPHRFYERHGFRKTEVLLAAATTAIDGG